MTDDVAPGPGSAETGSEHDTHELPRREALSLVTPTPDAAATGLAVTDQVPAAEPAPVGEERVTTLPIEEEQI